MSEHLDQILSDHFSGTTDAALIRRMEQADDFRYDDESYELSRRLKLGGQAWRWAVIDGKERVEVYTPGEVQQ